VGFEANHGRVMDSANIYLRNCRHQIVSQPTEVVIGLAFLLSDGCLLEEISHLKNFLSAILMVARVGEEEVVGAALFALELLLVSPSAGLSAMGRSWTVFSTIEHRVGAGQEVLLEAVKESSKRLEGERAEVMGLGVHSGINFICALGHSVMICFPRKRCLSISTTRTIRMRDRGAKKLGGLKFFEVRGVLKKEPRFDGQD
jgi:hypothetical protein